MFVFTFSDDGYYSINVGPPESKGDWKIQAASISPVRGIQMAIPQHVLRRKPFEVQLLGIPKVSIGVYSFYLLLKSPIRSSLFYYFD